MGVHLGLLGGLAGVDDGHGRFNVVERLAKRKIQGRGVRGSAAAASEKEAADDGGPAHLNQAELLLEQHVVVNDRRPLHAKDVRDACVKVAAGVHQPLSVGL